MVNWGNVFPLGIVFAIMGGILGAVWASLNDDDNWQQAVAEIVIASVLAASLAEYQLPLSMVWVCAAGGIFAGLITGHLLDAVSAAAPNFIKSLIEKMADKYVPKEKGSNDV